MTKRIALSLVPRELGRLTGKRPPSYRKVYGAVVDGSIPAERGENGRWDVSEADMPQIAAMLGLTAPSAVAA